MKTDFVQAVRNLAAEFDPGSKERQILLHLALHHVGEEKAITLPALGFIFGVTGHWIQQRVIAPSRRCDAFLATSSRGVFVIGSEADAKRMLEFYEKRIAAETTNKNRLLQCLA